MNMKNKQINYKNNSRNNGVKKKKKSKPVKVLHWIKRQSLIARRRKPRNFEFEIDWPRVEVADKTVNRLAKFMDISEEQAFDVALDILESNESFRIDAKWIYREYLKNKFRGEWIHLQWHTFENLQIGIENNRWTRVNFSDTNLYLPETLKQEIYNAEDGRCEQCGQAMHFRVSFFAKRNWTVFNDPDNFKLLCYCCAKNRNNMLLNPGLILLDRNMEYLRRKLGMNSVEEAKTFIRSNLQYAVHTNTFNPNKQANRKQVKDYKIRGQYWLPGIGRCRLQYRYGNQGKEFTLEFTEIARDPKLVIQPQSRTRGFSKRKVGFLELEEPVVYLTTSEAAKLKGVSSQTIRNLCEAGKIEAERTSGGHWRIPITSMESC